MISRIIAVIFAVQLGLHAANVYSKFGFFAACIAIVFMLAFGEVLRSWIKMIRSRLNGQ